MLYLFSCDKQSFEKCIHQKGNDIKNNFIHIIQVLQYEILYYENTYPTEIENNENFQLTRVRLFFRTLV